MKINCPACGVDMEPRTGKYGDFFYCRDHGTISKPAAMYITEKTREHIPATVPTYDVDLTEAVQRAGIAMGHHIDELGQLVDWYNDNEGAAEDDDDHWMNIRPY